jgi:hypothetical protein
MAKPTIDDAVAALEKIGEAVTELGIAQVAEKAGLPERVVRKFVRDVMASKNSDIRKITNAVRELAN